MQGTTIIRVRYQETDQMGVVYHGNYLTWFEVGRTEIIRQMGLSYNEMEQLGVRLPVTFANCQYRIPARYDDELLIVTELIKASPIRLEFAYQVRRGEELLAEGSTGHAFIDKTGKVVRIDKLFPQVWSLLTSSH